MPLDDHRTDWRALRPWTVLNLQETGLAPASPGVAVLREVARRFLSKDGDNGAQHEGRETRDECP